MTVLLLGLPRWLKRQRIHKMQISQVRENKIYNTNMTMVESGSEDVCMVSLQLLWFKFP